MLDSNQIARKLFGQFTTGVCILLAQSNDSTVCNALTINSFSSLSLEPLLVTFSLKNNSRFMRKFNLTDTFSINILAHDQVELAKSCSVSGGKELLPQDLLCKNFYHVPNCLASFECRVKDVVEGGDHALYICAVTDMYTHRSADPLVFFNSKYHSECIYNEVSND